MFSSLFAGSISYKPSKRLLICNIFNLTYNYRLKPEFDYSGFSFHSLIMKQIKELLK
jgi:hypothetical protein